jgi:hypothetical protein
VTSPCVLISSNPRIPFPANFRSADHTPEIAMPMLANASMWALNAMAILVRQPCAGPLLVLRSSYFATRRPRRLNGLVDFQFAAHFASI